MMEESEVKQTFWSEHRFMLLIGLVIVISIVLTIISMFIYTSSGAEQLDLSRPGYISATDEIDDNDKVTEYSSTGAVNADTIKEFQKLYNAQVDSNAKVDAFGGDPLNPDVLEASADSTTD